MHENHANEEIAAIAQVISAFRIKLDYVVVLITICIADAFADSVTYDPATTASHVNAGAVT
jgi:hypothetical protein